MRRALELGLAAAALALGLMLARAWLGSRLPGARARFSISPAEQAAPTPPSSERAPEGLPAVRVDVPARPARRPDAVPPTPDIPRH